jgi:hypothetical protein
LSIELDLVQDYMASDDTGATELSRARSILDEAIAAELAVAQPSPHSGRRRWSIRLTAAGIAATAACAVLMLQLVPPGTSSTPVAAAAQLAHLADVAQPAPVLEAGQWSTYQMKGVVDAHVYTVGKAATPDATAAIPLSFQVWSNSTGSTCTTQQFGTASFAGTVNAQAWHAIGLIDTPADQPVTGCEGGLKAGWAQSPAAIDVSALTHDPAVLATELQSGATGILSLNQAGVGDAPRVAGFLRLAILLVGPTTGQWSGFGPEMLRTLSLLPGVISLGDRTAHSGRPGPAFTAGNQVTLNPQTGAVESRWKGPTLILDGQTGALLEASSFNIPLLQSAGQDFVGSPDAAVLTQGVGYGVTTDWIDPVGAASVVTTESLPSWMTNFHIVEAVTLPNTPESALDAVINAFLGNGNSEGQTNGLPTPAQGTLDISIIGSASDLATVVAAFNHCHLFASVVVKL